MPDEQSEPDEHHAEPEESQNGHEEESTEQEAELAQYLEQRIKPNLSSSAIPPMARAIAKEIAGNAALKGFRGPNEEEDEDEDDEDEDASPPDFEADMHDLQRELGEGWILRFSVRGEDGWLTAEKEDASQRVEASDAERLLRIVEAVNEDGGREG